MTIEHRTKCDKCKNNEFPKQIVEQIGNPVNVSAGKVGDSYYTFFQCLECGSIWLNVKDCGGLGGKGSFYHLISDRFF